MNEEVIRESILKIVSNSQGMKVLEDTIDHPKSAYDISITCKIPLTQVYRWIRKLQRIGFLRVSGATNSTGKKYFMYQSKIKSIKVTLGENSKLRIEIS